MPKRFTDSEKWKDPWFRKLTPTAKLMCLYLYDRCDIAGFWEIDLEGAAFEIGVSHQDILEAMKGLERCYETNGDRVWVKRFIRFQGNKELNENNKAHQGIIRLLREREGFSENVSRVLNGIDLPSPYEGASMPLLRSQGISKGLGNGNGKEVPKVTISKEDLSTLTEHYATIRGARPRGNAWLPIQQGMKAMVVDEAYTVAQITGCMDRLVEWGVTWQINTVRRWIADYAAGKMPSKNGGATSGNDPRQQMKSYAQHDPSIYEHRLQGFKEGAEVYETSFAASDERRRAKREAMNKEDNDED